MWTGRQRDIIKRAFDTSYIRDKAIASKFGNSAKIIVPRSWLGRRVIAFLHSEYISKHPHAPLFQVVALDLRGYNLSDKPRGGEHYWMHHLVEDVQAVIHHTGKDKATIIGHDWDGAIAWIFAVGLPTLTDRLIILNCPHPTGITRELAHNPQQQEQSAYARDFQKADAHKRLTPESLSA